MKRLECSVRCERSAAPVQCSSRVLETAGMFGLGLDENRAITIVPQRAFAAPMPGIIFITGPSGGGKSTLINLIRAQCRASGLPTIDACDDERETDDLPVVDVLGTTLEQAHSLLARVGLADAFTMLRAPGELSDGQRYRLRLARLIERAERLEDPGAGRPSAAIFADEFCALLDRATAQAIARNLRRWIDTTGHAAVHRHHPR